MLAGAAAVAVLVAGCQSEGPAPSTSPSGSSTSPTVSPSVAVTPSATESGPQIPAAAREQTEAGAIAFTQYFFDQVNVAWTEPRAGLIASLSDPKCQFCKASENDAAFLVDERQRYEGPPAELLEIEAIVGAPEGQQFLAIKLEQKGVRIVDSSGAVVGSDKRLVVDRYVALVWSEGRWVTLEVEKTE